MTSSRCLVNSVTPGMLLLAIMVGLVNCMPGKLHPRAHPEDGTSAKSISAEGSISSLPPEYFRANDKGEQISRPAPSRAGYGLLQHGHQAKERETRPSIVTFEDQYCQTESGGVFLPMAFSLQDASCVKVTPREEMMNKTSADGGNRMIISATNHSMVFSCSADMKSLLFALHFGSNCSLREDDNMKIALDQKDFEAFKEGKCIRAYNSALVETAYIKVMNPASIETWPECMMNNDMYFYVAIVLAAVIVFGIAIVLPYTLKKKNSKSTLALEATTETKEDQVLLENAQFARASSFHKKLQASQGAVKKETLVQEAVKETPVQEAVKETPVQEAVKETPVKEAVKEHLEEGGALPKKISKKKGSKESK